MVRVLDTGLIFLFISGLSTLGVRALPMESPLNTTTFSSPSNSSSEMDSNDTVQIHSVLPKSLRVSPPNEQVDDSTNENTSQPSSDTTVSGGPNPDKARKGLPLIFGQAPINHDRNYEKLPAHLAQPPWAKIASEILSTKNKTFSYFFDQWHYCTEHSANVSLCEWYNYEELKGTLSRMEDLVYLKLMCTNASHGTMKTYLKMLNSRVSDIMKDVAPLLDQEVFQAKQQKVSRALESIDSGNYDQKTFCGNIKVNGG